MAQRQVPPEQTPHTRAVPTRIEKEWVPAFVLERSGGNFILKEVALSLPSSWKVGPSSTYPSPGRIPRSVWDAHRRLVQANMDALRLSEPRVRDLMENNLFIALPLGDFAHYIPRVNERYSLVDPRTKAPYDHPTRCFVYDFVALSSDIQNVESKRSQFIHEILHDAFDSFPQAERDRLGRLFNSIFNSPSETDSTRKMFQMATYLWSDGFSKEIDSFVKTRFPRASEAEANEIRSALKWFCFVRSSVESKVVLSVYQRIPDARTNFMNTELFSYLIDFGAVPQFLRPRYSAYLTDAAIAKFMSGSRSSYLSTERGLESFVPTINEFIRYAAKSRMPP